MKIAKLQFLCAYRFAKSPGRLDGNTPAAAQLRQERTILATFCTKSDAVFRSFTRR
jgi:hypothetical protein